MDDLKGIERRGGQAEPQGYEWAGSQAERAEGPARTPEPAPAEPQAPAKEEAKPEPKLTLRDRVRRSPIAFGVAALVLVAAIVAGVLYYLAARHFETTDDAFIDGHPTSISPQVTGNIVDVRVTDNEVVHAGDLLVAIDPRDYEAAVQQAEAQIAQAEAAVVNYQAQIQAQRAQIDAADRQVEEARAALAFAKDQNTRAQHLVETGFGTVQSAQQSASDLQSKTAALNAAQASRNAAARQIDVLQAQVKSAQAQVLAAQAQKRTADANLSRTQLHATMDARVTNLTAAVGAVAMPAQALMVLVPIDLYVTANFKETQLADIKIGDPVDISIDAFGKTYQGHVNSVQAGSGTAFSLLPAQNATGNYVKVVQRIPVKVTFDAPPDRLIGPGMSVVPKVRVR